MRYLIGRLHEIALKGRNQWRFVAQLERNLRSLTADLELGKIRARGPRLEIELPDEVSEELVRERARLTFGFANFSIARLVEPKVSGIASAVVENLDRARATSFAVRATRADKKLPFRSIDVEREVGAAVARSFGWKVDLENPELTIFVEVFADGAYISFEKIRGAGGLPVGVSGHGMVLLSGGIDSPVAAYRMMRRGMRLTYVHFHSYPLVSGASKEKACELVETLVRYQASAELILVPFGELQRQIVAHIERPLRVVLYRRFMLRIAANLAEVRGAKVLVTGESLGQVASQTLDNMIVIEKASPLPVLRPLIGMDKDEIVKQARAIGTFDISILPDEDCCTLFVPRNPDTHAKAWEVEAAEAKLDLERLVGETVARVESRQFRFPKRLTRGSDKDEDRL